MTLWGYQVDLDAYVYSNVYVTPIHLHRKRKEKKNVTVCEDKKITIKIGFISIIK